MTGQSAKDLTAGAVRIVASGLGAAVAGPLGAAIGGWLGDALGPSATALIKGSADKFGEKAADKLIELGADSLAEKLKASPLPLESAYREALRLSLREIGSQIQREDFADWFTNWDRCLSASGPLDLSPIEPDQLASERLDDLFRRTLERLDAQGAAISRDDLALTIRSRTLSDALVSELEPRLPGTLLKNFHDLIVQPKYEQAWKQEGILFQELAGGALLSCGDPLATC